MQLVQNLKHFDPSRFSHELVLLKSASHSRLEEVPDHVRVTTLREVAKGQRLAALIHLGRFLAVRHPKLVHATLPFASLTARVATSALNIPYVESLVTISHEKIRLLDNSLVTPWKLQLHTQLDRITSRRTLAFHAVSERVADSWSQVVSLPRDRITTIPRGVDTNGLLARSSSAPRSEVRAGLGVAPDAFLVANVGRLEPAKGQRYLIEAMAQVARDVPNAHAVIVGDEGLSSPDLRKRIRALGLERRVRLAGIRKDVPAILRASDVFAFPSLYEGNGGNALIEALALGLPVVTTRDSPMTDIVPDESVGLLVPARDPRSLARAIVAVAHDERLRTNLNRSGPVRVAQLPSPEEVARRIEDWYAKCIAASCSK